jgi:D-alanyl-D-alanine carboxypeptidase
LKSRLTAEAYKDGVVGKTGTLPQTDGGVSTLAGIIYTKDYGPVLFSIFNTRGTVDVFRRLQDSFLQDLIREAGGIASTPTLSASSHTAGN